MRNEGATSNCVTNLVILSEAKNLWLNPITTRG